MFEIGQLIMYASRGVCRVDDIGTLDLEDAGDRVYYTLTPLFAKGTFYIPVDSKAYMRPIMTEEQAREFVSEIGNIKGEAYFNKNMTSLKEHYSMVMQSHDSEKLVQLIKGVWEKTHIARQNGKTPAQIDRHYMEKAEDLLYGELSCALNIPKEHVVEFITETIGK